MVVPVVVAVSVSIPTVFVPTAVSSAVTRFVFPRSDEIHRPITRMIMMAMRAPFFCMPWRYVHVHRFDYNRARPTCYHHRLRIHDGRRCVTDIDPSIDTGLNFSGDVDADIYVACVCAAKS